MPETQVTKVQRIGWALLIAATLYICYFSNLNTIGFVGPDEPRYAWIARDMAETGDWVTPRLYGRPWFEKPPLLYWGGAIFFKLMPGQPEIAARLPSAICALLATLTLAWLAWRAYGAECARWLLFLLPATVGMIGFSHACATDMPFAGMLTIALACAAVILGLVPSNEDTPVLPRTPWLALLLFGFFTGLAVLAKGPAALILIGGAVFFWALFTRCWRDAFRLLHPAAIAVFLATALPWYVLCARRNADFFRVFIIEHNFKRYLTPEFQHIQPFWFYVPVLLIAFLPWAVTFAWGTTLGIRHRPYEPLARLLLCWSSFCLLFFSMSRAKLPGYILPAIPALALLSAINMQNHGAARKKSFRASCAVGSLLFGLAAIAFFGLSGSSAAHLGLQPWIARTYALFALCFALFNLLLVFVRWDRPLVRSFPAFLATMLVVVSVYFVSYFIQASFPDDPSSRTLTQEISRVVVGPAKIYAGPMKRGRRYGLNFYLNREIPNWDPANPAEGLLLTDSSNCRELVPPPYLCGEAMRLEKTGTQLYPVRAPDSLGGRDGRRQLH